MKIFYSSYMKAVVLSLCSTLSGTALLAANWNPLPDTGVTKCHDDQGHEIPCPSANQPFYGQDAQYISTKPSYRDLLNGTVQDYNTGLIWQKNEGDSLSTWQDANNYCETLVFAGISEWRLPTIYELLSIADYSHANKIFINKNFFTYTSNDYWSKTKALNIDTNYLSNSWNFNYYFGWANNNSGSYASFRCVHGQQTEINNFSLTGGGNTVTDSVTGLEWQKSDDGVMKTWRDALDYCENLISGDSDDWRLPNIKELNSIIDYTGYNPAINSIFSSKSDQYWSSTSIIESDCGGQYYTVSRYVNFQNGLSRGANPFNLSYVRCVRGGLSSEAITAKNYQFGNVDPRSDRFSVWMDISVDGQKPVEFCSFYQLSVNGDNGKGAKQILCTPLADTQTQPANTSRYRIDFEINKDETYPTAAYFENGKIRVRNVYTGSENILNGLNDFSVYGTTFDLREDAWSFKNGSWKVTKGVSDEYRKVIADEIDTWFERFKTDGETKFTRQDFNDNVGTEGYISDSESNGLCYGLASSAIADFTRKGDSDYWGKGDVKNWKTEIDNHWDKTSDYAIKPYKPYNGKKIHNLTWEESAKMIMYYFAAQPSLINSYRIDNWVGKDGKTYSGNNGLFASLSSRNDELVLVNFLLKKGRPVLTTITNHAIALVQLLRWTEQGRGKTVYMFWDNNYPYSSSRKNGPYVEWHIQEKNGNYDPTYYKLKLVNNNNPKETELYSIDIKDDENVLFLFPCFNSIKESQNIYNLWEEPCLSLVSPLVSAKASSSPSNPAGVSYNAPDHIEAMFIGGAIDGIFNQATGEKIVPVFASDSLQPGQADIQSTMGGTWHLLHLPADATYRIEATKAADTPYAEVYATIPYPNGTVDKLHYDNIQLSENSATKFSFLIGRSNSDKIIHRTGGTDKSPDYDINVDVAITPPSGFAGIPVAGQVQLRWKNSSHPRLSLVKVVRKTTGFPSSPTDGEEVYSGLSETATDSTVQSGTLYYYAAFSMDSSGNFSDSAAAAVDTARFAVTGIVTNNGAGLPNAKVEIRNSEQFPVGMTYTGADGSYVFANLENGSYTVKAEIFGYSLNNSPQSVTVSNQNATADFTATAVPALRLPFDMDSLRIGSKVQIAWTYRNIDKNEMISVQKIAGGKTVVLAEVPASANYILWNVDGPATDNAIIKLSLKSNPAVAGQDELRILPATAVSPQSFLPAIELLLRKKK